MKSDTWQPNDWKKLKAEVRVRPVEETILQYLCNDCNLLWRKDQGALCPECGGLANYQDVVIDGEKLIKRVLHSIDPK